jgi:hypothetical protein
MPSGSGDFSLGMMFRDSETGIEQAINGNLYEI